MNEFPKITPREPCHDCAFRKGTGASESKWTQLKVRLCLETGTPFECHETNRPALCRGFVDAMQARIESGVQAKVPEWKWQIYSSLQTIMDRVEAGERISPEEATAIVLADIHVHDRTEIAEEAGR